MKTGIQNSNSHMEYYTLKDGTIVVQLGGMQISRRILDNIKSNLNINSDADAANTLVQVAERAFTEYVERYQD
tara:strand:+ start:580 stop:798 length:219 start_codon:yes stop_codon:yes gene_type:complete